MTSGDPLSPDGRLVFPANNGGYRKPLVISIRGVIYQVQFTVKLIKAGVIDGAYGIDHDSVRSIAGHDRRLLAGSIVCTIRFAATGYGCRVDQRLRRWLSSDGCR
jgi:hypothetical protein